MQVRSGRLSSAAFLKQQGWGVGTVLAGGPITHEGREIERPMQARITAVGESSVLARSRIVGEGPGWAVEMGLSFDARDWTLLEAPALRTIVTVEELAALPRQSVVVDVDGWAYQRVGECNGTGVWGGGDREWETSQLDLPMTLIYPPVVSGG